MANEMPVPPQQPIVTFFNPNRRDLGLVEIWSTERATDEPIDLGTPHPNTRDYPGFRLGLQAAIETEDGWWKRVWVTDETNPDWFNYEIKYAAEGIAFPTYIRQYRIDKKIYSPIAKGATLNSVYILKLDTAGSGYTVGTFPVVTISGGGGSGASGHAIVNLDGTISDVVLDDGGNGYTTVPAAAVEDPPIGVTATATAFIQPQTAILIAEQAEEFPQGSEFFGLYFNVTRVYETIPGPTLDTTRLDDDGKVVNVAKTKKLIGAIVDEETIVSGRWCKTTHEDDTLLTATEVVECRDVPGNPILFDKVADDERVVYGESILSDQSTVDASATEQSGSVTRVEKDAVTELVAKKVTTVKEWPPDLKFQVQIPDFIPARFRGIVPITTTAYNTPGVATLPVLGVGELERIEQEVNDLLKRISVTGIANVDLPVILTDTAIDKNCVETTLVFTFDLGEQVLNDGNDPTFSNGEVTHLGAGYTLMTEIFDTLPSCWRVSQKPDEDGVVVTTRTRKNLTADIIPGETIVGNVWTRISKEGENGTIADEVEITRVVPGGSIPFAKVAQDERVVYGQAIVKDESTIVPGATLYGSAIIDVDKEQMTDLVSKEVTTIKNWPPDLKFKVSIPDFIPARFRGIVPTSTRSYNTYGTAVAPVLGAGELERIEAEVNDLLKNISITDISSVSLPIILTDTAIDKECVETTLVFTFDLGEQTLNSGNDPTFSNGEVNHLGAGYTLMTEIFDTLPSCWRVSQKPDEDGNILQTRTRKNLTSSISPGETVVAGVWTRVSKEGENGTIADEVEVTRVLPGNPIPFTRLDDDGAEVVGTRQMMESVNINTTESVVSGTWRRNFKKEITELVSWQLREERDIPGPQQEGEQTGKWGKERIFRQKVLRGSANPEEGYLVKESKFDEIEGSHLVATKITVFYPPGLYGVALEGQDYDPRLDAVIPFVQKLQPISYGIGVNREDINPVDYEHAEVRTIDPATVQAVLDDYVFSYPGRINVDMPDILTRVDAVIETSTSDGADSEIGASTLTGNGSLAQTLTAQSQASANVIPEAYPTVKQFWGNNIACQHYHFFLANPVTLSDVTAKLNSLLTPDTVSDWPKFNPEIVTLVMTGGRVSVQAKAHSQGSYAISGTGEASTAGGGAGYSEERGLTVKTLRISPTIHSELTVYGDVYGTENVTSTASAEAAGLGPAESQTTGPIEVVATVTPSTIPATIGATVWPTTGLYLYRTDPHPYRYGYIEFHCVVVNAADFPNVP